MSVKSLLVFIVILSVPAQDLLAIPYLRPRNNISLSLFGDASIISVYYERISVSNRKFFLTSKIGMGYSESLGLPSDNTALYSLPVHITGNYGAKKHYVEFGFGATALFYENLKFWDYSIFPMIGYRLQPLKKDKVTLRIYASYPLTDKIDIKNYWFSPVGFSIGFCF